MVQPDLMEAFAQCSILSNDCSLNQVDIKVVSTLGSGILVGLHVMYIVWYNQDWLKNHKRLRVILKVFVNTATKS